MHIIHWLSVQKNGLDPFFKVFGAQVKLLTEQCLDAATYLDLHYETLLQELKEARDEVILQAQAKV
jgi:hypothetical protein